MAMKQSKYSKRRPLNSKPIGHKDVAIPKQKEVTRIESVDGYEMGFFIDDVRHLGNVNLPKAKEWKIFRSYGELSKYLFSITTPFESVFISFDHYLDEGPDQGRYNGDDCSDLCYVLRDRIAKVIDIQGHSSEPSCNERKMKRWYW